MAAGDLEHVCSVEINDVYMFMGRELEALEEIPAGNILGTCKHYCTGAKYCFTLDLDSVLKFPCCLEVLLYKLIFASLYKFPKHMTLTETAILNTLPV